MSCFHYCLFVITAAQLSIPLAAKHSATSQNENVWEWEHSGFRVYAKLVQRAPDWYIRYEIRKGSQIHLLTEDPILTPLPRRQPADLIFATNGDSVFAIFQYCMSDGAVYMREFSVQKLKPLRFHNFSSHEKAFLEAGRGNGMFFPLHMLTAKEHSRRDVVIAAARRVQNRWLVTMKVGADEHVFYRADREATWHLQMDDEKDWLAKDPVLCGSTKVTIDGEEKTLQLWNQIAVRQNIEQQIASYKIPDINFMWVDLVNADGSTRRIWDAPDDELTFGTIPDSGFIACFDESKSQIAFAFRDRFKAIEYYDASAGQNLPKTDVLSRTQSYIQRTDGRGAWPGPERYGRNMFDHLSSVSMAQPEVRPLELLKLIPLADRMQLEATVNDIVYVLEIKDGEQEWQYRRDLIRPVDEDNK